MSFKSNKGSKVSLSVAVLAFVLIFSLAFSTLAFADFSGAATKILGVGRIQSATPTVYVDSQEKLQLGTLETAVDVATVEQLAAPIEREVVVAPEPEAPVVEETAPTVETAASEQPATTNTNTTAGDWITGLASAYDVDAGTSTATGATVTSSSMGVAVPAEWRYLLGSSVEISYNGMTVTAIINDTGGFLRYGRDLDLQPGVWRAFGFSDQNDWGVRTVKWRIVG
ncbi:MAG: hypothetical protein LBU48_06025 [Coriobacteriales bacterium]|nr:hypothetical protein [Coriobacteriales bacterium]